MTVDDPRPERADAARNRRAILDAAGKRCPSEARTRCRSNRSPPPPASARAPCSIDSAVASACRACWSWSAPNPCATPSRPVSRRSDPACPVRAAPRLLRRVGRSRHRELRTVRGLLHRHRRQRPRRGIPRLLVWTHRGTPRRDPTRHRRRRSAGTPSSWARLEAPSASSCSAPGKEIHSKPPFSPSSKPSHIITLTAAWSSARSGPPGPPSSGAGAPSPLIHREVRARGARSTSRRPAPATARAPARPRGRARPAQRRSSGSAQHHDGRDALPARLSSG